ncbi:DUF974-domain-containing protein [Basidiobolus meristosporus CBS 931.73]|uniref:DUF974-domain-containing protein n=1 Tax=Basidiobolus meristosporus CBS 931.73 TaxID=1314790 RepID=A0A1Y1X9C7_9FUNG|nr:DUF974-domain-containing protein [Basidiobolus meristosporus CBS 931.73]|eukprot:ORX82353.1 DUF974-domain-containing protein [Basidiobolus meristosporus CBS 931.73]
MTTTQTQGLETEKHLVGLRLMRLSQPTSAPLQPIYFEHGTDVQQQLHRGNPRVVDTKTDSSVETCPPLDLRDLGLSETLLLPNSWGTLYLGETLACYICLSNEDTESVRELGVKVEIQTTSSRIPLADTTAAPLEHFAPKQTKEIVVRQEIKELGIHILVCSAQYLTPTGERKFFRQFYKFQTLNPLAVKTKVNNRPDGGVLLEIQLQNTMTSSMFLEQLRFEPPEQFNHSDLNQIIPSPAHRTEDPSCVEGLGESLSPSDIRQYVYLLTPKSLYDMASRTTNALGKLDIMWRSSLGESGRLQTSPLTRKVPPTERIELRVVETPRDVFLEKPFRVQCRMFNRTPAPMRAHLATQRARMDSVLSVGHSSKNLGDVPPNGSLDFSLDLVPLSPGLQRIGGIRILDSLGGYSQDFDYLWDVFVCYN